MALTGRDAIDLDKVGEAAMSFAYARRADLGISGRDTLTVLTVRRGAGSFTHVRMAQHIDWHSTMLVPLQANATAFHEVTVHGQRGLLMESKASKDSKADAPAGADTHERRFRGGRTLLWTEQGHVYALMGRVSTVELMQCAESVR